MRVLPLVDVVAQLSACASSARLLGLAGERAGSTCVCLSPSTRQLSLINVCVCQGRHMRATAPHHLQPPTLLSPY